MTNKDINKIISIDLQFSRFRAYFEYCHKSNIKNSTKNSETDMLFKLYGSFKIQVKSRNKRH